MYAPGSSAYLEKTLGSVLSAVFSHCGFLCCKEKSGKICSQNDKLCRYSNNHKVLHYYM